MINNIYKAKSEPCYQESSQALPYTKETPNPPHLFPTSPDRLTYDSDIKKHGNTPVVPMFPFLILRSCIIDLYKTVRYILKNITPIAPPITFFRIFALDLLSQRVGDSKSTYERCY